MLRQPVQKGAEQLTAVISPEQLLGLQQQINSVYASDDILDYILRLVTCSRESNTFPGALSPRASKALLQAARSWAVLDDRDYLIPEDVQAVLPAVAEHRLRSAFADHPAQTSLSSLLLEQVNPLAA